MSKQNQHKPSIPELRFPEFGGEWEEKSLNDLGNYKKSYTFSRAKEGPGKFRHVHYGDIHTKLPSIIKKASILPSITEEKNFSVVEKGDLIFADASEDYKDLGKATMVDFDDTNVVSGLHTHLFRPSENIVPNFLTYYTETGRYKRHIKREGNGISVLGISKKNLGKFKLFLPSIQEQQRIGDFFSKLDRQIELEEKKLALLEEQKKGYMQKIFSQELRFKDENGNEYPEWGVITVGEIANIGTGNKDTKDAEPKGKYNFYVRSPKIEKINSYSFEGEAVLTVGDGVGVGRVFHYVNGKFDYHQRVYKISNFNNYYAKFFYYYFSFNFKKEAQKYNAKTSVDSVRKDMISKMKVPLCNLSEQKTIGLFLETLDSQISKQCNKKKLLIDYKRTLLSLMFI